MRSIVISRASHELVAAHSPTGRVTGGRELPDGRFEVEVDDEVAEALERVDPDPDVAIRTVCSTGVGHS